MIPFYTKATPKHARTGTKIFWTYLQIPQGRTQKYILVSNKRAGAIIYFRRKLHPGYPNPTKTFVKYSGNSIQLLIFGGEHSKRFINVNY